MMTVNDVSKLSGVSIKTLQYYDKIGLLKPKAYSSAGYRLYDEENLDKLQQILFFKELEFPLKEIKKILSNPNFDKTEAIKQQIKLLELKKEHIDNLILFAKGVNLMGTKNLNFEVFDTKKIDEYALEAKTKWGNTPEFREFEEKSKNRDRKEIKNLNQQLMQHFVEFGQIKDQSPKSPNAQDLVKKLQEFITENFYTCSNQILSCLGKMYGGNGDFAKNIDNAGGEGTAAFASKAITEYCK